MYLFIVSNSSSSGNTKFSTHAYTNKLIYIYVIYTQ